MEPKEIKTFKDYRALSSETAIYPDAGKGISLYPFLGLAGEVGEVIAKVATLDSYLRLPEVNQTQEAIVDRCDKISKEIGDVFWYLAAISNEAKFQYLSEDTPMATAQLEVMLSMGGLYMDDEHYLGHVDSDQFSRQLDVVLEWLSINVGKISELVKKSIRDSNGDYTAKSEALCLICNALLDELITLASYLGLSIEQICKENLEKLFSRKARGKISGSGDER